MADRFKIKLINPADCKISGVKILPRVIHFDSRGFLIETLRSDDWEIDGGNFAMGYNSMTPPGVARDENSWHYHQKQIDRFICVKGRIALALFDARRTSKTAGILQILDLLGAVGKDIQELRKTNQKKDKTTFLVTVPIGIYHCYKNIGQEDCYLVNFPTQLYNPNDEGRKLFAKVPVKSFGDLPFSWDLLES